MPGLNGVENFAFPKDCGPAPLRGVMPSDLPFPGEVTVGLLEGPGRMGVTGTACGRVLAEPKPDVAGSLDVDATLDSDGREGLSGELACAADPESTRARLTSGDLNCVFFMSWPLPISV